MIVAVPVGTAGFVSFVKSLERLGVLTHDELLGWLRLHGALLCAAGLPLDRGGGVPDEVLLELEARLV